MRKAPLPLMMRPLERKVGIGVSDAGSATAGQVLTRQANGNTAWAAPATGALGPWKNMADYASPQAAVDAVGAGTVLVVDRAYTLSSTLAVGKSLTLLCETPGAGFTGTVSGSLVLISASDVSMRGCLLDSNYPTSQATEGVSIDSAAQRVLIDHGRFTDLVLGVGVWDADYVTVQYSSFDNLKNSAVRSHDPGAGKANEHLLAVHNNVRRFQRGAIAGNGAFQTAGSATEARQLSHQFVGNDVDAVTSNGGSSLVAFGLDQCSYCLVDSNIYRGVGISEGIAISGHDNRITNNEIDHRSLSSASCILLWSQGGELAVRDTLVSGNIESFCAQGVAIVSGPGSPAISDVVVADGRVRSSSFGVQSYSNGSAFDGVRILVHGMNVAGTTTACSFEDPAAFTLADNVGGC